jgi:hypothetical protein
MGVLQVGLRHTFQEILLHGLGRLSTREPEPVRQPEDMCIDRNRRLAEGDVEHHVGSFTPDPRQGFQRCAITRNPATVLGDEFFREQDDVLGLVTE